MANLQPNHYVLQSKDGSTKVDYETSTIAGLKTLTLTQGAGPARHFSGSQIRTVNTEIGTIVSVTTRMTVDTGSTSFSLLIPAIALTSVSDHKQFTTEGIVTSHKGPDSVPSTGVQETYEFIPLTGQASVILTLTEAPVGKGAKA